MRRIDVLGIGLGIFLAGGGLFLGLRLVGLDGISAGIWSQVVMVGGLVGWLLTYLLRVVNHKMTFNQQLDDYESAVLQKRLEELTPEEMAALQAKLDNNSSSD
jgi:hypothetical protein